MKLLNRFTLPEPKFTIDVKHIIVYTLHWNKYSQKCAVHGSMGGREAGGGSRGWVVGSSWVAEGSMVNRVEAGTQS